MENPLELIIEKLSGTQEGETISYIDGIYSELGEAQKKWYEESGFTCTDGCGSCCHNFEPDLLESEVLYMAAWLISFDEQKAKQLAEGDIERFFPAAEDEGVTSKTCIFYNHKNPYHCSIYGGRPFICRLFGASGAKDKNGKLCWKPCKFYPAEKLAQFKVPLTHRQYNLEEVQSIFGTLPPVMSDVMEKVVNNNPGKTETVPLRKILPETIRLLYWILSLTANSSS